MSETVGLIETRSRSRSKTPGLFHENGDSIEKKGSKKVPTVSLIEEEDVSSQRPKRQRRSAKNIQSDTSNDLSLEGTISNNKESKTTTITTMLTTKHTINGSEEKTEKKITKTTMLSSTNNDVQEISENQSIFNNIFNAIKTSTPILSTKRTKRVTQESKTSPEIDYNLHPAYKEYKDAGEYWNKYPKTDYTYSELSPHRRELGLGVVAMPNMSRKSLDKYQNRIEAMILQNPTDESFIRRKFLNNLSYQKKAVDLQYDSTDEVDVSDLYQKLSARRFSQKNIFSRFFLYIMGVFSTTYSNLKQKYGYNSKQYSSYTPIKRHNQKGFIQNTSIFIERFILLCISKVYLFISTVLSLDTWLLYTRSENIQENQKRKKFLIGLLVLLPLMLFGVFLLSDEKQDASTLFSIRTNNDALEYIRHSINSVSRYFSNISSTSMPQVNINFGWILSPIFYIGALIRKSVFNTRPIDDIKLSLDEEKFQMLFKHINNYIELAVDDKFKNANEVIVNEANDKLIILIGNHIKDALNQFDYKFTSNDVEIVIKKVKLQIENDFHENVQSILSKIALVTEENVQRIKSMSSGITDVKLEPQNIDLDKIILMILKSDKIASYLESHEKSINSQLELQNFDTAKLKKDVNKMKSETVEKFENFDEKLNFLTSQKSTISEDLTVLKKENNEAIENILINMDERLKILSDFSSIDTSVKKSLMDILGLSQTDLSDETLLNDWIDNTFVNKNYLKEHLHNLELRLNQAFLNVRNENAEESNEKLKAQLMIILERNSHLSNIKTGSLSKDDVVKIVKEILAIYDADKTGLVDYALESAGGEVISTRCTENYRTRSAEISIFGIPIWYPNNTPRTVISPAINPGECWAFQGFPGYLVIKLNNLIRITGFTMEHIPQANAPNRIIDSAPNNFTIWGLTTEFDKNPILFGSYFYSVEKDAPSLQYFSVKNDKIIQAYQIVELVIESNHGNPKYTCLYRFRVHGEMNSV